MEFFVVALVAGGVLGLTAQLFRRRRRRVSEHGTDSGAIDASPLRLGSGGGERGLEALRPGDILVNEPHDYMIGEVTVFVEGMRRWQECALDEGAAWLYADVADGLFVVGRSVELPALVGEPSEAIDFEGRVYRLERCGEARATSGDDSVYDVRYWRYERPGSERIWIRRRLGGEARVFVGRVIPEHFLDLLVGS